MHSSYYEQIMPLVFYLGFLSIPLSARAKKILAHDVNPRNVSRSEKHTASAFFKEKD
jgi:hypothetical protein